MDYSKFTDLGKMSAVMASCLEPDQGVTDSVLGTLSIDCGTCSFVAMSAEEFCNDFDVWAADGSHLSLLMVWDFGWCRRKEDGQYFFRDMGHKGATNKLYPVTLEQVFVTLR
jgi:hypothetical protein